jgi:hypothetical protein
MEKENVEEQKSTFETIKNFLIAIPFSLLGFVEFYLIYALVFLAVSLLFLGLSYIPIISTLLNWFFEFRGDTPDIFAMLFAATIAYLGTTATLNHIIKGTLKPTLILLGIYLFVLNIIFLIVNIINDGALLANILTAIAGILMFYKAKQE